MGLSNELIEELIKYAQIKNYSSEPLLELASTNNGKVVPVASAEYWFLIAENIKSSERLSDLIKGMLTFCKENHLHTGGSVSPIRWLYEFYRKNYPDSEPQLCEWIVRNRNNHYEPFGTICSNNALSWKLHCELETMRKNK